MSQRDDPGYLRDVQYRTDANLAARQSIYAYQRPAIDLPARVLDLADIGPDSTVIDVGCGNGAYLAELARRDRRSRSLGVDMSMGMLVAARSRAPLATLLAGDAAAVPLADETVDLAMANHMLYHVPEPEAAIAELRRITRRGGRVIVTLNGADHLRELNAIVADAYLAAGLSSPALEQIRLDDAEPMLRRVFPSVTRHEFTSTLYVPGPEPVLDYVRSMIAADRAFDLAAAVVDRLPDDFTITTNTGVLVGNR
ncbi:MAG: class I SAM-dependent methyltransferase [Streptosporangiaceae bacterium]